MEANKFDILKKNKNDINYIYTNKVYFKIMKCKKILYIDNINDIILNKFGYNYDNILIGNPKKYTYVCWNMIRRNKTDLYFFNANQFNKIYKKKFGNMFTINNNIKHNIIGSPINNEISDELFIKTYKKEEYWKYFCEILI